jgi:hypothetical protein
VQYSSTVGFVNVQYSSTVGVVNALILLLLSACSCQHLRLPRPAAAVLLLPSPRLCIRAKLCIELNAVRIALPHAPQLVAGGGGDVPEQPFTATLSSERTALTLDWRC